MYIYIYIHVHIYICVYVYMFIHTYIYRSEPLPFSGARGGEGDGLAHPLLYIDIHGSIDIYIYTG